MFKKIFKWTCLIVAGLIAALLIANAVFVWGTGAALERRLQAIRDAGDPASISDLARPAIPPDDNAATFLRRAEKDLIAIDKDLAAFYKSETYRNGQLGSAEVRTLADVLEAHAETVALVARAAACPAYDPQPDCSVGSPAFLSAELDRLGSLKGATRLLAQRTTVLLARGQCEEAAHTAIALLRLVRHFDDEPLLVGHLMTVACRAIAFDAANGVLRSGPLSDATRDALDQELAQPDPWAALAQALKSERGYSRCVFGDLPLGKWWPTRGLGNNALIYYLDVMQEQISMIESPTSGQVLGQTSVPKPISPWLVLTDMILPAIQSAGDTTRRTLATQHCLRVLNSVTRLEQRGVRVTGLADLKVPVEQTTDPFTGASLLMKELPEGWLIYSVGVDGRDDGGRLADPGEFRHGTDLGVGPVPALPLLE